MGRTLGSFYIGEQSCISLKGPGAPGGGEGPRWQRRDADVADKRKRAENVRDGTKQNFRSPVNLLGHFGGVSMVKSLLPPALVN